MIPYRIALVALALTIVGCAGSVASSTSPASPDSPAASGSGSGFFSAMGSIEGTATQKCAESGGTFGESSGLFSDKAKGTKVAWDIALGDKRFECRVPEVANDLQPIIDAASHECSKSGGTFGEPKSSGMSFFSFGKKEGEEEAPKVDEPKTKVEWSVKISGKKFECRTLVETKSS